MADVEEAIFPLTRASRTHKLAIFEQYFLRANVCALDEKQMFYFNGLRLFIKEKII